jgi:outer membrane receptor for ferrienterochelin and colicin
MGTLGIVDFRYEIPANNLKPEKSIHYEIGYRYIQKQTRIELSIFYLSLKDIINRQKISGEMINGYQVYEKKNAEQSCIKGFELSAVTRLCDLITWSGNLTYTYGQNISKNEPMRRIPPLFGHQELTWERKNTQIQLTHLFAGKQDRLAQGDIDDNRIGPNGTPNWNLLNFMWSQQVNKIQFQIGGLNLLNEKYKTHGSGIYGMGRTYCLQMHFTF